MKKVILLSTCLSLFVFMSYSQTYITTPIINTTTWTYLPVPPNNGSPYYILTNITVPIGQTLTIDPRVQVIFMGIAGIPPTPNIQYKLDVYGSIIAIGTTTNHITFTASIPSVGWQGIHIYSTNPATGVAKFNYCEFHGAIDHPAMTFNNVPNIIPRPYPYPYYIQNSLISNNHNQSVINLIPPYTPQTSTAEAAGIQCYNSSPDIVFGNEICYNYNNNIDNLGVFKFSSGTAISCNNSSSHIEENNIHHNYNTTPLSVGSGHSGLIGSAAICCINNSNANLYHNTISYNESTGRSACGGIICSGSSPNISLNTIEHNVGYAGGIDIGWGSSPHVFNHNQINHNYAYRRGGGILIHNYWVTTPLINDPIIEWNHFEGNYADETGGGMDISTDCSPTISNNDFIANYVNYIDASTTLAGGGGALSIRAGGMSTGHSGHSITINSNLFEYNQALIDPISGNSINAGMGGGIYIGNIIGTINIQQNTIINNHAINDGGGIYCYRNNTWAEVINITGNPEISGNQARNGSGIYCNNIQPINISDNTIINNNYLNTLNGGGIYYYNCVGTISGNTISTNACQGNGGGIYLLNSNGPIFSGINNIDENTATGNGGGIYTENSALTINGSTIGNSINKNRAFNGAGIYMLNSTGSITNTINENIATNNGGGIFLNSSTPVLLANTISINSAIDGGGLYIDETSVPVLNSTNEFSGNEADKGGGIFIDNPDFDLSNQVIKFNEANLGAGIYTNQVSADITGNTITGNIAVSSGGGIFCNTNSSPNIYSNNDLSGNVAYIGGGIFCQEADPYIDQLINNNTAISSGGGITITTIGSNPTFGVNTVITDNSADYGGGIYLEGTDATIDGIEIFDNNANDSGGGIYISGGYPTVSNSYIHYNHATSTSSGYGGGIHINNGSTVTITTSNIEDNNAKFDGGGIYVKYSSPTIENIDEISDNTAENGNGGGIYLYNCGGTISEIENIYENEAIINTGGNYGGMGGAIYCYEGTVTIEYSNIIDNHASFGCGVYFEVSNINSSPTLTNCSLIGNLPHNAPGLGGAIYCYKSNYYHKPLITLNTIDHNGGDNGAGIYCQNSSNYIQYNTITYNTTDGDGGGIFCTEQSHPYILYNTITDNTAVHNGGGVFCDDESNPLIQHNIINTNVASTGNGGGICVMNTDANRTIYILNNLIASNQAYVYGGGIYLYYILGSLIINSNTIADNYSGSEGGGVYGTSNYGTFYNDIIYGNTATQQQTQSEVNNVYSGYNNFFYSDIGGCGNPGNYNIDADPRFYSSGNYHLQYNNPSPCLDIGDNNADHTSLDLDFTNRIQFTTIDMGCYEQDHFNWLIIINDISNKEINHSANSEKEVSILPNPFTESTNISFVLAEQKKVYIIITDLNGKEVFNYQNIFNEGYNKINWVPEENSKGMYLCKIFFNSDKPILKKLIYN